MQRCKSAYGLCKGAKLNTKIGRGVALPRPCLHRRARRSLAPTRERGSREAVEGQHVVLSLPEVCGRTSLCERTRRSRAPTRGKEAARLARSANLARCKVRYVRRSANGRDAVAPLPDTK